MATRLIREDWISTKRHQARRHLLIGFSFSCKTARRSAINVTNVMNFTTVDINNKDKVHL
ncbi:hypothetical protein KCP77_23495 [Salmonella enterica subsp. enterica]|nr:hypothetical protein KCP77_23495 [Salmonella enterica subsp. enterica]